MCMGSLVSHLKVWAELGLEFPDTRPVRPLGVGVDVHLDDAALDIFVVCECVCARACVRVGGCMSLISEPDPTYTHTQTRPHTLMASCMSLISEPDPTYTHANPHTYLDGPLYVRNIRTRPSVEHKINRLGALRHPQLVCNVDLSVCVRARVRVCVSVCALNFIHPASQPHTLSLSHTHTHIRTQLT